MIRKPVKGKSVRGFTLIEILVVVAIIALLISILLPSLKKAREQGRTVMCMSQLDQIMIGTHTYANESDDMLPYYGWMDDRGTRFEKHWWPTQVARQIGNEFDIYKCPSDHEPYSVDVVFQRGSIYMYRLDNKILWPSKSPVSMDLSYRGACDLLREIRGRGKTYYLPRKVTDWKRPYKAILLIEANAHTAAYDRECFRFENIMEGIDLKYGLSVYHLRRYPHLRSWLRHNGRSNLLFMDAHVETLLPRQVKELAKPDVLEHKL
ncbi:MAG: prepilin-type N-terminal cleavage/methylation domain-containing protein [Planctomycetota bacterium]|nr:MAG: prepilin-type N-terminal cleavage/methylation domain-containing protein [Planctomycetota bacterium]